MGKREGAGSEILREPYLIRFIKGPAFLYMICLNNATGNDDVMKQYNFEEVIDKIMMKRILSVIEENKCIKAIEIANILGTDRKTINHYLYSGLRWDVEKDQNHYWSLKGHRPKQTSDGVFYLTEYIPKRLWQYKNEEELEESRLVLRLKDNDPEAVDIVKERMLDAAEDLVSFEEYGLIVAVVPSSKTYKESPMLSVASYIRDCFNGPEGEEDPEYAFLDMFSRIRDVKTSHFADPLNRPKYDEHKATIKCNYPEHCNKYTQCLILDDVTTTGAVINACRDLLKENGMPEDNIIPLVFAKTV